jgi:cation-transporting P-type ATPase C
MGAGGSDVAIEAADIALSTSELWKIPYVRALSQETIRIIEQNYRIATYSNLSGVVLAALGLINPIISGFLHISHSMGILLNSTRLLAFDMPELPPVSRPVCAVCGKLESDPCAVCAGISDKDIPEPVNVLPL